MNKQSKTATVKTLSASNFESEVDIFKNLGFIIKSCGFSHNNEWWAIMELNQSTQNEGGNNNGD